MSKKNDPMYPNPYSTGALTTSMAEHTAGRRYRVRDADGARTWGKDLSFDQAHKLKEKVAALRKSKNPIIEDMNVPEGAGAVVAAAPAHVSPNPQDAMRQMFEAGRQQGRAEGQRVVIPPVSAPVVAPPPPAPESQNGAGALAEIDTSEIGDLDLVDSAIDDSLQ